MTTIVKDENNEVIARLSIPYFDFELEELIEAKYFVLNELRDIEYKILKIKIELEQKERTILLNTDFKKLGLTNEKARNAYVKERIADYSKAMEFKKLDVAAKEDELKIINNLIKINELKLEGELKNDY